MDIISINYQVDMMGNDLTEYVHPMDADEMKDVLTIQPNEIPSTGAAGHGNSLVPWYLSMLSNTTKIQY